MIAATSRPRPSQQAVFRDLADGGVVLHLGSGQYHGLNRVGAEIWTLLDGRMLSEVVDDLRGRFPGAPLGFTEQVAGFVDSLAQRGLVAV